MGSSCDPYESFAERYDLFDGAFGIYPPVLVDFYRELLARYQVHRVLDCACGTGKHLPLFCTLGCEVVGSDLSPAMLAQARKNLAGLGIEIPLHRVDYRELPQHFAHPFDAVTCLSSSILHMPDEAQVLRAFESMRGVLRPGGILVLTQGTSDRQWREKPRFIPAVNEPDFTRLFVIDYAGEGATYHILDIHHSDEVRDFRVWSITYPRMILRDDQERLLKAAGFATVTCYGNYRFQPYDTQTSQRLIVVAQKGGEV
jgi:glycine/sarcosine N-methyltransferase